LLSRRRKNTKAESTCLRNSNCGILGRMVLREMENEKEKIWLILDLTRGYEVIMI
jgi:hypothetical protein